MIYLLKEEEKVIKICANCPPIKKTAEVHTV